MLTGPPAKYISSAARGKSSIFKHAQIIKFGQTDQQLNKNSGLRCSYTEIMTVSVKKTLVCLKPC